MLMVIPLPLVGPWSVLVFSFSDLYTHLLNTDISHLSHALKL